MALAVYSISRMSSLPWTPPLRHLNIQSSERTDLPQIDHPEFQRFLQTAKAEGKWTLLSFWSVTCPPCLQELPSLNAMAESWQGPGLQVMTVNGDQPEDVESARSFLLQEQISIPSIFDPKYRIKEGFKIEVFPTHFLIDPEQKIVWREIGAFDWNSQSSRDQIIKLMERQAQGTPAEPDETVE